MAGKDILLHADDGTVYKISEDDLQKHKVADDDPNLATYRAKANKASHDDACLFIAAMGAD